MKIMSICLVAVGAGCVADAADYPVSVRVNADAYVCIQDKCGDALVWGPFETQLPAGTYEVRADARDPLEHLDLALEVGPWGPNRAWANFAHGAFDFARIEFLANELVSVQVNDTYLGMTFPDRPLVYWFAPRQYVFCAQTLDETRSDCAAVDLSSGAEIVIIFAPR